MLAFSKPEDTMGFVNNNKEPITVIQYKYHEGEFGKLLNGAFVDFTKFEEKIIIYARDKSISVKREPLVLFSPLLRSILDSLSCCSKPAVSLPDCSSSALEHLWRIVQNGVTDFEGELNTSEIIVAAKCLQIDVTNFEYVKKEAKVKKVNITDKNSEIYQTNLTVAESGESDSDLDETVVDDYGEDDELDENMEMDDGGLGGTKVNDEIESFLKLKSQMQSLLDDDEHDDQGTLDEKAEDRSFTFNDGSNDSTSSSGSTRGVQTCQICNKKSRNLSFLWQHYCKTHFMKQLKTDCDQHVNVNNLKCNICEETLGSKQDLYMHVGINHEKLNLILQKNGQYPLESLSKIGTEKPSGSSTENKKAKFRIPKKTDQIPKTEVPQSVQTNVPAIHGSYQAVSNSGDPNYVARPQMAAQPNSQNWSPALPMSSQPPFRHNNSLQNRPLQPTQIQPPRAQPPPRHSAQYNPQLMATPPPRLPAARFSSQVNEEALPIGQPLPPTPRPQSMGLWAQSAAKLPMPNSSLPEPLSSGLIPRTMANPEVPRPSPTLGASTCQICQKTTPSVGALCQHYARTHFFAELKSDYSSMANITNKSCNDCGSHFKAVDALFLHIGTVHRKVNEIMEKKGLVSLDLPLRSRKSM